MAAVAVEPAAEPAEMVGMRVETPAETQVETPAGKEAATAAVKGRVKDLDRVKPIMVKATAAVAAMAAEIMGKAIRHPTVVARSRASSAI